MDISVLFKYFPLKLTEALKFMDNEKLQEIRIIAERNCAILKGGKLCETNVKISAKDVTSIVETMCRGSLYALQSSLSSGFFTIEGGHRVGVCGKVSCENGKITHMSDISALCIRISREIIGAADNIMDYIECEDRVYNTLIISPPGCGKTTVLRDIARNIGNRKKVCIVDERSEIAACIGGVAQNDIGKFTCVLDRAPKTEGMRILLRTMAPDVIITDETGGENEEQAIYEIINCGIKLITTIHGYNERDILRRQYFKKLMEMGIFERIIVLSNKKGPATIEKIITDGRVICLG